MAKKKLTADKVTEQAQEVRERFGTMLTEACSQLAKELDGEAEISTVAFALGLEWAAMTFAAAVSRMHNESKEGYMALAEAVLYEDVPEAFRVAALRNRTH